jgi:hypothetical protein
MQNDQPDTQPASGSKAKLIAWAAIITAVALFYLVFTAVGKKSDATASTAATHKTAGTTAAAPAETRAAKTSAAAKPTANSQYKDGTYSATGTYHTPESTETVDVTLTVKDGAVADSQVDTSGTNSTSVRYQTEFKNNYKPKVVGKKLDDIQLSRVSGSSLTSGGFNTALEQIKDQARG